jgi:hypothetical protein
MMWKQWLVPILPIALLFAYPIRAQELRKGLDPNKIITLYVNGEQLTEYCRSFLRTRREGRGTPTEYNDAGHCYGFITGVYDTLSNENLFLKSNVLGFSICIPTNANAKTLAEIVGKFLDDNPKLRVLGGYSLVLRAWAKSFPCP